MKVSSKTSKVTFIMEMSLEEAIDILSMGIKSTGGLGIPSFLWALETEVVRKQKELDSV